MTPKVRIFLPPDQVLRRFADVTGSPVAELAGPALTREITLRRHEAMWVLRHLTTASLARVGELLGDRDAKSVENGVCRTADRIAGDDEYRQMLLQIVNLVAGLVDPMPAPVAVPIAIRFRDRQRAMAAAVLNDPDIPDADAKLAAITLLRMGAASGADTSDTPKGS